MQTGTLSGNTCSAYGAPATIAGTTAQTVATAHCYLLTLTGTDNVGNAASITTTVMVDTTAPSAPTGFAFSGLTNSYYPGAGTIVYFKGGAAGGFTATASGSADADTGIAGYNYGAVAGTGWANAAGAYTFTAASPTGTSAVTASNNAGLLSSSTSFTAQVRRHRPRRRRFHGEQRRGFGRRQHEHDHGWDDADDQQPHRLHRRRLARLASLLDADHADRNALRQRL